MDFYIFFFVIIVRLVKMVSLKKSVTVILFIYDSNRFLKTQHL